ncbi:MAG: dephospho-CoA kinase [Clostridia bacterium]
MQTLAITGGIACGKSTATAVLRTLGAPIIDADAICHALTAPEGLALPDIRAYFGDAVFALDGTLNRRALAQIVFADLYAKRALEAILHPRVQDAMEHAVRVLESQDFSIAVLDVPLLYEAGMERMADQVWVLYVPETEQIRRICERDGLSAEDALTRIHNQMSISEKIRRADVVIDTSGTLAETAAKITVQWRALLDKVRL